MVGIEVREATPEDIAWFAANMRPDDVEEVWALARLSGYEGLMRSYEAAAECHVGVLDGRVFCVFGLNPGEEETSIWMLFSKDVQALPVSFFRKSREYLSRMLAAYGRIGNYVKVENVFILKWLKWLGFNIGEPEVAGVDGVLVRRFWKGWE